MFILPCEKNCGGTIIEIGSFKGKSSVCLVLASKAGSGGKVFAIDPHKGLKDDCDVFHLTEDTESIFKENIRRAKVDDIIIPLVMKSERAINIWSEPISLLFIDGAHDYENVKLDFNLWEPFLIKGSTICFHDALYSMCHNYPGIRRVIINNILKSNKLAKVQFCGSIVYATKVQRISLEDRILKFQKFLLYYYLPLAYVTLALVSRVLAKAGLLGPAKLIKEKISTLIHRRSHYR